MVVILILPSSTSSTNGCDEFHSNQQRVNFYGDDSSSSYCQTNATNYQPQIRQHTNTNNNNNDKEKKNSNTTKCVVRHVTRVNISDVYSQVELDGSSEPVTKEGESTFL